MSEPKEIIRQGLLAGTKNTFIHIDSAKNGKDCNCVCSYCGAPLVARNEGKGGRYRQNTHHFAHDRGYEECGKAGMSTLHKMAQKIIEEKKSVMLPKYLGKHVQYAAEQKTFENIKLEKEFKDEESCRRPDCIGWPFKNDDSIWIEIYCTHPITLDRKEDIKRRKQYCIEIDFSDLLNTDFTEEIVRQRLLNSFEDRVWICHPEWDEEERLKAEEELRKKKAEEKAKEAIRARIAKEQEEKEKRELERLLRKEQRVQAASSTPKSTHTRSVSSKQLKEGERDWVMYAKTIYGDIDAVNSLFRVLANEYTKVTLENSHQFVADEVYLRCNELLPRVNVVAETQKRYLVLLLSIWVLDRLNHSKSPTLGKFFVDNSVIRNEIFRAAKQIGSIDKHPIDDTIIPAGIENRDVILQILRTCYM